MKDNIKNIRDNIIHIIRNEVYIKVHKNVRNTVRENTYYNIIEGINNHLDKFIWLNITNKLIYNQTKKNFIKELI